MHSNLNPMSGSGKDRDRDATLPLPGLVASPSPHSPFPTAPALSTPVKCSRHENCTIIRQYDINKDKFVWVSEGTAFLAIHFPPS